MKHFHGYDKKRSFFEGWYLKHQSEDAVLALIPAYHTDGRGRVSASLQIVTGQDSFLVPYSADDFLASTNRFAVMLGNNTFSDRGVSLDISTDSLYLKGKLNYGPWTPPQADLMGPFRHFPFMECNHGIMSFTHSVTGAVNLNGWVMNFSGGAGFAEKDWGRSFPTSYLWAQCCWTQRISNSPCSIMLAIAEIPFFKTRFTGCIGSVFYGGSEYLLATYRGAKILEYTAREAVISQGDYLLHVNLVEGSPQPLHAPRSGNMSRTVQEHPSCQVRFQFFIRRRKICDVLSRQAGFETGGTPGLRRRRR